MEHGPNDSPHETDRDRKLEAIIAQYIRACESGFAPDRLQILGQHPELAVDLQQFFGQRDLMDRLVEPIREFTGDVFQSVGPGQQISYVGNYELLEEIARGGMGVVYKARQVTLGRMVAVKMIRAGCLATADDIKRFQAEAQAAANLQHPNIVSIHEVGQDEGWHYFSMDYVEGRDLAAILREKLLPAKQAAEYVRQMAEAIHYAHQQGTLHRDLKPSNVMIDAQDQVQITDFGLAMRVEENSDLTRTGQIVGTASYMPPEQAQGKRSLIGAASDVYSLGAVLYECLTGRPPFRAESVVETIQQVIHTDAASPRLLNPAIPRDLETICLKCLQKEPHRRYGTAQMLAEDLERFLGNRPILARPVSALEKSGRWCLRNPVMSSLAGIVFLALAATATTFRLAYDRELAHRLEMENKNSEIGRALQRETFLKQEANRRLYRSLVDQARASRLSRRIGQRFATLDALAEAATMARNMNLPSEEFLSLRNEAIACLPLLDLRIAKEWDGFPVGTWRVTFSGTLERYARVDRLGAVSVRRIADDVEICHLSGIGPGESFLSFSPDGNYLAQYRGQEFELWKLGGEKPERLLQGPLTSFGFSNDNRQFARTLPDGSLVLYDLPSAREIKVMRVGPGVRGGLAFHPRDRQIAVPHADGVHVRDLDTGRIVAELMQPMQSYGCCVAWHPDGNSLAMVGRDRTIHIWDVANRKRTLRLEGHRTAGIGCAFNHAGSLLASGDWDGMLRFWDPRTGQQLFCTQLWGEPVFSPDDQMLAVGGDGKRLQLWNVASTGSYRTLVRDLVLGKGEYFTSAVHPNGRLLAVGMKDAADLWDLGTGNHLAAIPMAPGITHVLFESSGALLTNGRDGLHRWPIRADSGSAERLGLDLPQKLLLPGSDCQISQSRDGRVLASAQYNGGLVLHADRPGQQIPLRPHGDVRFISVSPDGRLVATGSHNGTGIRVWEALTGKLQKELPAESGARICFSPDSRWLATTGGAHHVWAVDDWRQGPEVRGSTTAFSPDSKLLAVETGYGVVRLIDPDSSKEYARLEDPNQDRVGNGMTFTPDGRQLVLTNQDSNSIHVWDLRAIRAELVKLDLDWELPAYRTIDDTLPPLVLVKPDIQNIQTASKKWNGVLIGTGQKASWSADGQTIAFTAIPEGIQRYEFATHTSSTVQTTGQDAAIAPGTSKRIAFVKRISNEEEIWLMDGDQCRKIGNGGFPSWRPDGQTVIALNRPDMKLRTVDVEAEAAQMTDFAQLPSNASLYPFFTSDCSKVAYSCDAKIEVRNLDDGSTKRFEYPNGRAPKGFIGSWHPDGKLLAFGSYGYGENYGSWVLDTETGEFRPLLSGDTTSPVWSPDGLKLAVDLREGVRPPQVWVIDTPTWDDLDPAGMGATSETPPPLTDRPTRTN